MDHFLFLGLYNYFSAVLNFQCELITALSLKCHAGCMATGGPGSENACNGLKTGVITCERFLDRCMTMKVKMSPFPGFSSVMEMKNCSSSFVCDPNSEFNSK